MKIYPSERLLKIEAVNIVKQILEKYDRDFAPDIPEISYVNGLYGTVQNFLRTINAEYDDGDIMSIGLMCKALKGSKNAITSLLQFANIPSKVIEINGTVSVEISKVTTNDVDSFITCLRNLVLEYMWVPTREVNITINEVIIDTYSESLNYSTMVTGIDSYTFSNVDPSEVAII